ncbi:unnamed protein product, partial [Rotaria sp. Silwood2]
MPSSPQFHRPFGGSKDYYYYQAIHVAAFIRGTYSFESLSDMHTMGFLYDSSFDPSNLSANLVSYSDNNDTIKGFRMDFLLSSARTYILVVTTSEATVTGDFWILVHGSASVRLTSNTSPTG